jgi:hypothetical protein
MIDWFSLEIKLTIALITLFSTQDVCIQRIELDMRKSILTSLSGENSSQFPIENNTWETQRKKELPPLKETVQIYRKQNAGKQQELFDKWHDTNHTPHQEVNILRNKNENSKEVYFEDDRNSCQTSLTNNNQLTNIENEDHHKGDEEMNRTNRKIDFSVVDVPNEEIPHAHTECAEFENLNVTQKPKVIFSKENDNKNLNKDYQKLALELVHQDSKKSKRKRNNSFLPDIVLVFNVDDSDILHKKEREIFESKIKDEDVNIVYNIIENTVFVELYASFERLCQEAETVALEMPLEGVYFKYCQFCKIIRTALLSNR